MTNFEIIDAVQRSLEKEGLLQAVRAQLRASVFKIISNGPDYIPKQNDVAEFASTIEGRASLLLISELLEKLKLTQSLSVFQAECGTQAFSAISTKEVEDLLHLSSSAVSGKKSLLERLVARQSGIGSPRESQHSSEAKEYGNSPTGSEYKHTGLTSLPNRRSEFKHSSAQYFEGVPTAKSDDESDHEESATAQPTNSTEKGAHPSLLNSKSYDFNEVVEPEEDIEEEYASEEDEQENDVANNGASPDFHSDAKQVALNASPNQEKKQEKKGERDIESDEEDELSVNNSRGGSDWEDDKPVVDNVKSDSNLNSSSKGTSGRGNVSMDISSSFEAEASNSSFSLGNASANRREPLKSLPPVSAPAATRYSESKVSESKANSDSKHDHSESDVEDEVLSEEEGPEVDSEEEVDQLAQSGRLHTSGDITHVGVSGVTGAHVGAATKKVEVRGAIEDKEDQDGSDAVLASGLGNLVNKAKVMRMNQSATTSRSKTGWGDMSGVNRDNEFDSDRDSDHSPVKGRNNDDLRDISEDNIEEDFDSRSRPTLSGNITASSSIPRSAASSSAWGSSPKISKSPVKGPGRHNDTSRGDSKVDSSFEAESDEDHESSRQLHMSYRSNQDDEEDVIEHEEEEDDEEHSGDSREHRSSSEENTRAFTTRDPPSKAFNASTKTQDTKQQEEEDEEPEYDDYAEDFEDEEGHDSRNTSRHSDIKFSSSEAGKKTQQLHLSGQKQRYEAEEELSEVEEIEEDMSVGQNSDEDSDHDTNPVNKHRVESSAGSGMSRGRSGLLPDLPSTQNITDKADTSDFDSNQYFNNDDDDEEDGDDGEVDRLGEIERRMAEMEREDATLVNLKRNLQNSNNDASEVYSESGSVASEDIEQDVMEFSAGGDDRSDSEDGF